MDPHTVMYRDDRLVKHIKTWTHTQFMHRDDRLVKHIKTWTHTQSCIEMIDLSNTLRHGPTHSHA